MINVSAERIVRGAMDAPIEIRRRYPLAPDGLSFAELRLYESGSDFVDSCDLHISRDGGQSWGPWEDVYSRFYRKDGEDEYLTSYCTTSESYNPHFGHYVGALMERDFPGGKAATYARLWGKEKQITRDRVSLALREPGETEFRPYPLRFAEGEGGDEAYYGTNVAVTREGDILLPLGATIAKCCEIAHIDPSEVFPSAPDLMRGCIIARGRWNRARREYEFTYSKPMVISDLLSSRGLDEPTVEELPSGRVIVVFRGSNVRSEAWGTRIEPGAPALKWYAFSDDGGKTFSPVLPWRFDNGEVVYSSATLSMLVSVPGRGVYWLGNLTGPGAQGNMPRFPLAICRVDDKYGTLQKDTLTIIDTRREGETAQVQLSNFFVSHTDTGLEVTLTKFGQLSESEPFHGDTWRYHISFD